MVEPRGRGKHVLLPEEIQEEDGKATFLIDATGDWQWSFDVEEKAFTEPVDYTGALTCTRTCCPAC